MLVGMPDYDNYVEHMRGKHPDKPVMSYEEFFRERQEARMAAGKDAPSAAVRLASPGCARGAWRDRLSKPRHDLSALFFLFSEPLKSP